MKQNKSTLISLILGIISVLFAFLTIIMYIVVKREAWDYVIELFSLIALGGLLALIILNMLNIKFNHLLFFIPLGVVAIAYLLSGIRSLINIGDAYETLRYSYFTSFINSILSIGLLISMVYGLYKMGNKKVFFIIPISYIIISNVFSFLYSFNQVIFSFFTVTKTKYALVSFFDLISVISFYVIYIIFFVKNNSENK
ncbi:hypothetical protein [Bovifimicola ammoniilytica]|uniref:hypothetical protein n=1 Tax=Bovifimicola ammoniilytica TaxID=2981720 RepID=UPI00033DA1D9|nr:hypothetical protein [Bovifimicola ammoniilytica]MCU6752766.1 hypothetical protein [Bovifimicola ammoniilytica]CCZ05188.1 unknown [Eubacterium sp. CAG:603]SCJ40386.1 Uncharacterised protein [uncultured Eubacterium sp.]